MPLAKPLAVIQPRVSSREQRNEGYSLPAQEKLLRDYCDQKQFQVDRVWSIAETASKPAQRKLFREMMEYVREHDIKIVVVEKVDRLVRSFVDLVAIDNWLEEVGERQVHFVKDSIVLHRAARSQEKLNWGLRVLLAKNFIDNMKEEVEKGIQEKLAHGGLPGRPPIGYIAVGDIGRKELLPDEMGVLVTRMFDLYLDPIQSVASLTREMEHCGLRTKTGRPVVITYVREMLSNPIYIGKIPWAGRVYDGHHQPLVHPDTFQAVQDKLADRRKASPMYQKHDPLFRGRLTCHECKSTITWELQKGRYYGRCKGERTCSRRKYVREDQIESVLEGRLDDLLAPSPEIVEVALNEAQSDHTKRRSEAVITKKSLERRLQDLERRALIAYEDRLDGRIPTERYDEIHTRLSQERVAIAGELEQSTKDDDTNLGYSLNAIRLCLHAGRIYRNGSKEDKRSLLAEIFSNLRLEGEKVAWEWTKTVAAIAKAAETDHKLHDNFEPDDFGSTERQEALTRTSLTLWLGLTSQLRTYAPSQTPKSRANVQQLLVLADNR